MPLMPRLTLRRRMLAHPRTLIALSSHTHVALSCYLSPVTLSYTHLPTLSLSLSLSHTHALFLSLTRARALSHALSLTHTHNQTQLHLFIEALYRWEIGNEQKGTVTANFLVCEM